MAVVRTFASAVFQADENCSRFPCCCCCCYCQQERENDDNEQRLQLQLNNSNNNNDDDSNNSSSHRQKLCNFSSPRMLCHILLLS